MRNCNRLVLFATRRCLALVRIARLPPLVVLTVGLVAMWAIAATEARASCGDYVHVAGGGAGGASLNHDVHRSIDFRPFLRGATLDPAAPAPPTPSCQGPNCRRQIPQPNPPVPPVAPAGAHHWAYWLSTTEPPDGGLASLSLERSFPPLAGHRRAIDRPPRWDA